MVRNAGGFQGAAVLRTGVFITVGADWGAPIVFVPHFHLLVQDAIDLCDIRVVVSRWSFNNAKWEEGAVLFGHGQDLKDAISHVIQLDFNLSEV